MEEVTMCAEAWMASYLMEVGWELHVNSNPDVTPSLIKGKTIGNTTTFTSESISHDAVIDLLTKSKSVEKRCEFEAEGFRQSIYHWVKWQSYVGPLSLVWRLYAVFQ